MIGMPSGVVGQDQSDVCSLSGRVAPPRGGPISAITAEHSLLPTSHSPCTVTLPYGRDTTVAGCKGLPQLATEKMRIGEVGACAPVGVLDVAALAAAMQTCPRTVLVTACQPLLPSTAHGVLDGSLLALNRPTLP